MSSPRWTRILLCLVLLTLPGLACAGSSRSQDDFTARPNPQSVITVTNDHWYTVNIYHVRGGSRFRLGTVSTLRSETFRLPDFAMSGTPLQLLIDPVGSGRAFLTDPILVGPGQSVIFRVETRLSASSWFVR